MDKRQRVARWALVFLVLFTLPGCTINACNSAFSATGDVNQDNGGDDNNGGEELALIAVAGLVLMCMFLVMVIASKTGMGGRPQ